MVRSARRFQGKDRQGPQGRCAAALGRGHMNISENNVRFTLKSGHSAVVSAYPRNKIQPRVSAEPNQFHRRPTFLWQRGNLVAPVSAELHVLPQGPSRL
jgi:hypothetical protein